MSRPGLVLSARERQERYLLVGSGDDYEPETERTSSLGTPRLQSPRVVQLTAPLEFADSEVYAQTTGSCWHFAESSWFQGLSLSVIVVNLLVMVLEANDPSYLGFFFWLDQVILCFYVSELCSRVMLYGEQLLYGDRNLVVFFAVDAVVVAAGILSQWLFPLLPQELQSQSAGAVLAGCRFLRIFRVLKIVRLFLESDLTWTEEWWFQAFIGGVIAFNSVQMGIETDVPWHGWFFIEQVLLCIYVFELAVRIKHHGSSFVACRNRDFGWNVLDVLIVGSSIMDAWLVPLYALVGRQLFGDDRRGGHEDDSEMSVGQLMMLMRMMRLMRILRIIRLVKAVRPLYVLVTGVVDALQGVIWVLVLTITVLYCLGILTTRLIGHGLIYGDDDRVRHKADEVPFCSVPESMFTLFRVMSGAMSDSEFLAIDNVMADLPVIKLGFVFVMVTTSWTMLSILTAVVSENMITSTSKQEEELRNACAEESRLEVVAELTQLFISADAGGDGIVQRKELQVFCADKDNAIRVAHTCQVPVKDVKDVLNSLHDLYESSPPLSEFVECLVDVGRVATEKSLLRIEARLEAMQRRMALASEKAIASLESRLKEELQQRARAETEHAVSLVTAGQARTDSLLEDLNRSLHTHTEFERAAAGRHAGATEGVWSALERVVAQGMQSFEAIERVASQSERNSEAIGGLRSSLRELQGCGLEALKVSVVDGVAAKLAGCGLEALKVSAASARDESASGSSGVSTRLGAEEQDVAATTGLLKSASQQLSPLRAEVQVDLDAPRSNHAQAAGDQQSGDSLVAGRDGVADRNGVDGNASPSQQHTMMIRRRGEIGLAPFFLP